VREHRIDLRRRFPLMAGPKPEGKSFDDFEHILHSFPVFARKRKEFFAYLQQRLAEWKAEVAKRQQAYELTDEPLAEAAEPPGPWGLRSDSKP
jgi:hypothetical protein